MTTAFAQVIGAIQAALQQAPAVSAHVFRARARVLPEQMATAIVVRPARAEREAGVGQGTPALWVTGVALECYARGTPSAPVDLQVDTLLAAAVARLMADPTLGGLVGNLELQTIDWDFDVDGQQTACVTVIFNVPHATGAGVLN